jgi:hypothetical protein
MKNNMEMSLINREWKEFKISEIFTIGTGANVPKKYLKEGDIPRISATEQSNGVDSFTEKSTHKNFRTNTNFISVSFLGAIFYHSYTASLDMKIHTIQIKNRVLNKYLAKFIVYALKCSIGNTSYGNQVSSTDLPKKKLYLPINSKGKPDYDFMESFIRIKEQEKLNIYKNYILKRIKKLETIKPVTSLKEKEWEEFFLNEIFSEIQRGKRLKKSDHKLGKMPYVSSTAMNNGVDGFIGNKEKVRIFSNCLSLANSGSVGSCFYHPYKYIASDHVTRLENKEFNKYIYLFLSSITKRLGEKYSFNREINDTRIKREKILLPINEKREPDYEYMENYIKQLEYKKLNEYLNKKLNENTTA